MSFNIFTAMNHRIEKALSPSAHALPSSSQQSFHFHKSFEPHSEVIARHKLSAALKHNSTSAIYSTSHRLHHRLAGHHTFLPRPAARNPLQPKGPCSLCQQRRKSIFVDLGSIPIPQQKVLPLILTPVLRLTTIESSEFLPSEVHFEPKMHSKPKARKNTRNFSEATAGNSCSLSDAMKALIWQYYESTGGVLGSTRTQALRRSQQIRANRSRI
jgi:hypothetical protein